MASPESAGFEDAWAEETVDAGFYLGLFPRYAEDWYLQASCILCYSQSYGSGFSFTLADVNLMGVREIEQRLEWLSEQREREAKALKAKQ